MQTAKCKKALTISSRHILNVQTPTFRDLAKEHSPIIISARRHIMMADDGNTELDLMEMYLSSQCFNKGGNLFFQIQSRYNLVRGENPRRQTGPWQILSQMYQVSSLDSGCLVRQ